MITCTTLTQQQYESLTYSLISQLEGHRYRPYLDTAVPPKPTIGIGVNLMVSANLDTTMNIMGIGQNEATVRQDIANAVNFGYTTTIQLRNALDSIMAQRAQAMPGTRDQFRFLDATEELSAYTTILPGYESTLSSNVPGVPISYERAALLSLGFNGPDLLGPNLRAAIAGDDRAEAWYQIRYESNGGVDLSKRRYIESKVFSLYNDHAANGKNDVTDQESLLAFRAATSHVTHIATYEASHSSTISEANKDLHKIETNSGLTIGDVETFDDTIEPAHDRLIADFADPAQFDPDLNGLLNIAGYTGALVNVSIDKVWVAVDESSDIGAAHTIDRSGVSGGVKDLIFGSITTTALSSGAADTLKGGSGSDVIVGSGGADALFGGAGEDTVVYLKSTSGVTVNLATGNGTGGDANGDTYDSIENVIGSDFADVLTGSNQANVLAGGKGNDLLTGGMGDLLFGGKGADQFAFTGSVGSKIVVFGGAGNDTIDGSGATGQELEIHFGVGSGHDTLIAAGSLPRVVFDGINHAGVTVHWAGVDQTPDGNDVPHPWIGDGKIYVNGNDWIDLGTLYGESSLADPTHPYLLDNYAMLFADGFYWDADLTLVLI